MPTMHDVARRAGVSQSTVSRVLNNSNDIILSPRTIERVLAAAQELGYRIDPLARALKGKSTGIIGIITRRFDSFLPLLVSALSQSFRHADYTMIYGEANNTLNEVINLHTLFETQFCDGLVLAADPRDLDATQAANIFDGKHLVMTAWGVPIPGIPLVNTDNRTGIRLAMNHLFDLRHERIAFLDVGWSGDHAIRRQVYEEIMAEAGLSHELTVVVSDEGIQAGRDAAYELLRGPRRPTAILASEDLLAIGALRAAFELGLDVPAQVSVVGFDGLPFTEFSIPALTTVRQPVEQIASIICDLLVGLIDGSVSVTEGNAITLVEPELIIRETTAPPAL